MKKEKRCFFTINQGAIVVSLWKYLKCLYCKYVSYFRFPQRPTLHMLVHQPQPSIRSMDHTMEANKVHFSLPSLWLFSAFSSWRGYLLLWTLVLGLGYSNLLAFLTNFYLQGMKTWLRPQISLNPAIWISPRIKCLLYQVGCTEIKRVHNSYSIKTSFKVSFGVMRLFSGSDFIVFSTSLQRIWILRKPIYERGLNPYLPECKWFLICQDVSCKVKEYKDKF